MRMERQGLIIWFQHNKNLKQLKYFGHLIYVSKTYKYTVIYVNKKDVDYIETSLLALPFVTDVQKSYKPDLQTDFDTDTLDEYN